MSDFFSGIRSGIKGPDVVMGQGPLPPTAMVGMPAGFNGDPDGKINYNSTLLGDLEPYAYGGPSRLSTQTAYLNIPHKAQRIVPQIQIPTAQPHKTGGTFFNLSHQIQDGDIAFVIRAMFSPFELVSDKKRYARQGTLFAIDPICNLSTVNYILHGLQRYGFDKNDGRNWHTMWLALGVDQYFETLLGEKLSLRMKRTQEKLNSLNANLKLKDNRKDFTSTLTNRMAAERLNLFLEMRQMRKMLCEYLTKYIITPLGVPTGSDKQGGQHQGVYNSAVTWPVDFVTSMVIDGKTINLLNFWKHDYISAGDDLMLYLSEGSSVNYTLSHHAKSRRTEMFEPLQKWEIPKGVHEADGMTDRRCNLLKRLWDLFGQASMQYKAGNPSDRPLADKHAGGTGFASDPMASTDAQGRQLPHDVVTLSKAGAIAAYKDFVNATMVDNATLINMVKEFANINKNGSAEAYAKAVSHLRDAMDSKYSGARKSKLTQAEQDQMVVANEPIFQLTPGVRSSKKNAVLDAVWRNGFWHIARTQIMHSKYDLDHDITAGANCMNRGKMLEATFSPVWTEGFETDRLGGCPSYAASFSFDKQDMSGRGIKRLKNVPLPGDATNDPKVDASIKQVRAVEEARLLAQKLQGVVARLNGISATVYAEVIGSNTAKGSIAYEYDKIIKSLLKLNTGGALDEWQKTTADTSIKRSIALSMAYYLMRVGLPPVQSFRAMGVEFGKKSFADLLTMDKYNKDPVALGMVILEEFERRFGSRARNNFLLHGEGTAFAKAIVSIQKVVAAAPAATGATAWTNNKVDALLKAYICVFPVAAAISNVSLNTREVQDVLTKMFTGVISKDCANAYEGAAKAAWKHLGGKPVPNSLTMAETAFENFHKVAAATYNKGWEEVFNGIEKALDDASNSVGDYINASQSGRPAIEDNSGNVVPPSETYPAPLAEKMDTDDEPGPTLVTVVQEQAASLSQPTVKRGNFKGKSGKAAQADPPAE